MKAVTINSFGGPEVFAVNDVAAPEAGPGQVRLQVRASSVNPIDTKIRSGAVPAVSPDFPAVLHGDVAGVVESVGPGVSALAVGDEVFGFAGGFKGHPGALAELMVVDARLVTKKPAQLSLEDAGGLAIVGLTAWEATIVRNTIQPGDHVLVTGGTGGVGHLAVQLAAMAGGIVTTTASTSAKAGLAEGLGANYIINYKEQDVLAAAQEITDGQGFQAIVETVGGPNLENSFAQLATGGHISCIASRATVDLTPLHGKAASFAAVFVALPVLTGNGIEHHAAVQQRLAQLIDQEKLELLCDERRFGFGEVGAAHAYLESGQATGKIILQNDF
ncbi:MAG: zinc-binding dehydrogenase [Verrucomicrobiota bacterium]